MSGDLWDMIGVLEKVYVYTKGSYTCLFFIYDFKMAPAV
jgi:hypothetical protein